MIIILFKNKPINVATIKYNFPLIDIIQFGIHDFNHLKGVRKKRVHPHYTLHFIISGTGQYIINDNSHFLKSNDLFITPPNTLMKYYPSYEDPWTYIWFSFNPINKIDDLLSLINFDLNNPTYTLEDPSKLLDKLEDLFNIHNNEDLFNFSLYELFYDFIKKIYDNANYQKPLSIVDKMKMYLENNFQDANLSIKKMIKNFPYSHTYLTMLFKEETNYTIVKYLIKLRLEKAAELLKSPSITVKNAAYLVGYDDIAHFSKAFKQKYNLSPRLYQKNLLNLSI